jgi:hypothetical protein
MAEKPRINLTVDHDIPDVLERLAGGRNKMGDYVSQMVRNLAAGVTVADEIEKLDREGMRLMMQGLSGRVVALEGEIMRIQSQLAAIIASKAV